MKGLLTTLVVLAVLLLVADRGADWAAERIIADRLQQEVGLARAPDVDIAGFPFLTQLATGHYRPIRATATRGVTLDGVRLEEVSVLLHDARLPLPDMLARNLAALRVRRTDVTVRFPLAMLNRLLDERVGGDLNLAPLEAGGDGVLVTGTLSTGVATVRVRAPAEVRIEQGSLRLTVLAEGAAGSILDVSVPLPPLPQGFRLTSADIGDSGVTVTATSTRPRPHLGILG